MVKPMVKPSKPQVSMDFIWFSYGKTHLFPTKPGPVPGDRCRPLDHQAGHGRATSRCSGAVESAGGRGPAGPAGHQKTVEGPQGVEN